MLSGVQLRRIFERDSLEPNLGSFDDFLIMVDWQHERARF